MPTSFSEADQDVHDRLADVVRECRRRLYDAEVVIGILMASNEDGHAISHGGYPAQATMQVVSLKDRVHKKIDALIVIDLANWDGLDSEERDGLLHHEICHIDLANYSYSPVRDASGDLTGEEVIRFDRDDLGRPKLVSVKGDWSTGDAFNEVIARRGRKSPEFRNIETARQNAERALRERHDSEGYRHVG